MTTTEPPVEGFETKSTGAAVPGTPGYQMAGQPASEHGESGLQVGYSNSEGMEGDDGSSIFSESQGLSTSGGSKSASRRTGGKAAETKTTDTKTEK